MAGNFPNFPHRCNSGDDVTIRIRVYLNLDVVSADRLYNVLACKAINERVYLGARGRCRRVLAYTIALATQHNRWTGRRRPEPQLRTGNRRRARNFDAPHFRFSYYTRRAVKD